MLVIPMPVVAPLSIPLDRPEYVQQVWDAYVKPAQDADESQSEEMRMLMAILRAVHAGLTEAVNGG